MQGMGLCFERAVEDKENRKCRWPSGSQQMRNDSISSVPYSPRGSFNETLDDIPDEDEEEESDSSLKSPQTNEPRNSLLGNHLQVSSILSHRKNSRTSTSSGRSSVVSAMSVQSAAHLPRMSSLGKSDDYDGETASSLSAEMTRKTKPRRTVSLKLPRSYKKSQESETKLPTIYVDDQPGLPAASQVRRKSSLQMALSVLSLGNNAPAEPKPVQKILRQPQRRQHVRGISGLSIEADSAYSRGRRQTIYYPAAKNTGRTRRTSTGGYQ